MKVIKKQYHSHTQTNNIIHQNIGTEKEKQKMCQKFI